MESVTSSLENKLKPHVGSPLWLLLEEYYQLELDKNLKACGTPAMSLDQTNIHRGQVVQLHALLNLSEQLK